MTFADIINSGLNNPDCSFWVGMSMGQFTILKTAMALFVFAIVYKFIDKILLEPFINWIKRKVS